MGYSLVKFQRTPVQLHWKSFVRLGTRREKSVGVFIFIDGKCIVLVVNSSLSKYTFSLIDSNSENRFVLRQLYRRNRASLVDKPIRLDANTAY